MKVYKASAGSGKTYKLSNTYIDKLMFSEDRYEYRHILAVTFTNKATAEMKGRILKDLHNLSVDDENPQRDKARRILTDILHDYSAFSVSTIDKFFQQALKAFSREIGQFSSYQIELDRDSLIKEATDRILDGLTEDKHDVIAWLRENVEKSIEQGRRFSLDEGLVDMGKRIKSNEFSKICTEHEVVGDEHFNKGRLSNIGEICKKVIDDFHTDVKIVAAKVAPSITGDKALEMVERYIKDYNHWEVVPEQAATVRKACAGNEFGDLFDKRYPAYRTAHKIENALFSLGLSGEFVREFDSLIKEKCVMPLDDSNTILRDIIDGSDAPFVYEKLGVRYTSFLLDEFQDTSDIQWQNFLPLLAESEATGNGSMIVGDVKQSIYRWRDSNYTLLGEEVVKQFPEAEVEPLDHNWRSAENVVEFNSDFFKYAAGRTGTSDIYADVFQDSKFEEPQKGGVRLSFVDDQMKAVLESVQEARSHGANWSDIAVLVRYKKDGSNIASKLIENGIPVISDDSLSLKSSLVVRRLVSLLHSFENPTNSVGSYLASSMNVEFPDSYHSLVDMCESLLRSLHTYDPKTFEGETLFIQAFMDDLQSWVQVNGNNLRYYLEHWEESKLYIGSPENSAAVRILTIHKAKGLEFPYVIFPYVDTIPMYDSDVHWCWLETNGTDLDDEAKGVYPVNLDDSSVFTMFSDAYAKERKMQTIDNLNLLYVAFTRAVMNLHVISKVPSKTCQAKCGKPDYVFKNFSEVVYSFCHFTGSTMEWTKGTTADFTTIKRKETFAPTDYPSSYPSIPLGGRLKASEDALDYFGEDGTTGVGASPRLKGIVLHKILSGVRCLSDVKTEVDLAVNAGMLSADEGREAFDELSARVGAHPNWFDGSMKSRNEVALYDALGKVHRPDRVVFTGDGVIVVDYKFGVEDPDHICQVRRYMDLYCQMGYENVSGAVWYVRDDNVINVDRI